MINETDKCPKCESWLSAQKRPDGTYICQFCKTVWGTGLRDTRDGVGCAALVGQRLMTKPRKMWAYVATDGAIHLYTSQRKARGVWAEQGPTKRIREVYVQWPTRYSDKGGLS